MNDPRHLLDLIKVVKPRAALFTTYTFSVSYFDAVFLPVLRSVGCQDIAVLVDADQGATCVQESHSRAAGRVYRVATVLAPGGGVFHPKLAYLASEQGDVVAVGSGNLTASGQSLQLESFDAVADTIAPLVFGQLADWMVRLAAMIAETSPQAAQLLSQTAPRARQAQVKNAASRVDDGLPDTVLVETLTVSARDSLEAIFKRVAEKAESTTVLSPYHSVDGGPVLRLAAALGATSLSIGIDGRRLLAPFETGKFNPELPVRFVVADAAGNSKLLHAKVFELQASSKVLVLTGSVNATSQSFESTKNVEVSLARWLDSSPFKWKKVKIQGYEATQQPRDFVPRLSLYVEAWLGLDRYVYGRVYTRGLMPRGVSARLNFDGREISAPEVGVESDGAFTFGPLIEFDATRGATLTVTTDNSSASCWLNIHEELSIASEERERRSAIARVLGGAYTTEDVVHVINLLSMAAQGMASGISGHVGQDADGSLPDDEIEFSFMRWEASGHQRRSATSLGRSPHELLKALNRFLNADLRQVAQSGNLGAAASLGIESHSARLLVLTDEEHAQGALDVDPYQLLDRLCQAIQIAFERSPELEYGQVLAEVVASRAVDRALKESLQMQPCIAWLDRYSRFSYAAATRAEICAVGAGVACVTASALAAAGSEQQLSVMREAVQRFNGGPMDADAWWTLAEKGLSRDLFLRVGKEGRLAALAKCVDLAAAVTMDEILLPLLAKAARGGRNITQFEEQSFPLMGRAFIENPRAKERFCKGLLSEQQLKTRGCPFCGLTLSDENVATLRQRHALVHPPMNCKNILYYSDQYEMLLAGLKAIQNA